MRCRSEAVVVVATAAILVWTSASVAEPDLDGIAKITGRTPERQGDVVKIGVPRADLAVQVDGVALAPFQGLTSWAGFQDAGGQTIVMGDIVVTEGEANPALTAALESGREVTAHDARGAALRLPPLLGEGGRDRSRPNAPRSPRQTELTHRSRFG
jgi:Domain of Unknown Function (DUF1259)